MALATAALAVIVGGVAAWVTLGRVMDLPFVFSFRAVAEALGVSLGLVLTLGAFGTWRILKAPSVPYLRTE